MESQGFVIFGRKRSEGAFLDSCAFRFRVPSTLISFRYSGDSRHMIGYGDHLADIVQREFREKVVLGDNVRYDVKEARATSFQLDSSKTLRMRDVLLVPGMTSNLIVVSALEDEGYDVIFSRGRVFIQKFSSSERIEIWYP